MSKAVAYVNGLRNILTNDQLSWWWNKAGFLFLTIVPFSAEILQICGVYFEQHWFILTKFLSGVSVVGWFAVFSNIHKFYESGYIVFFLSSTAKYFFPIPGTSEPLHSLMQWYYLVLWLSCFMWWLVRWDTELKNNFAKCFLNKNANYQYLWTLLGAAFITVCFMVWSTRIYELIQWWFTKTSTPDSKNQGQIVKKVREEPFMTFVLVVLLAPLVEEMMYRSILIKNSNFSFLSIIVSSFIFAGLHWEHTKESWYILIPYLIPGFVLGISYYVTRNIWVVILAHSICNAVSFFQM